MINNLLKLLFYFLETCTDFLVLLFDLFGDFPTPDQLSGICIDRACDVHPYCKVYIYLYVVSFFTEDFSRLENW